MKIRVSVTVVPDEGEGPLDPDYVKAHSQVMEGVACVVSTVVPDSATTVKANAVYLGADSRHVAMAFVHLGNVVGHDPRIQPILEKVTVSIIPDPNGPNSLNN